MSALIEAEGVCKSFGGLQALSECSLSVAKGKIAGLIGPNGSGKTTLFNVMTGYERCSDGEIRFDGESITRATPERVFSLGVGRTFQITRLFFRLSVSRTCWWLPSATKLDAQRGRRAVRRLNAPALEFRVAIREAIIEEMERDEAVVFSARHRSRAGRRVRGHAGIQERFGAERVR